MLLKGPVLNTKRSFRTRNTGNSSNNTSLIVLHPCQMFPEKGAGPMIMNCVLVICS